MGFKTCDVVIIYIENYTFMIQIAFDIRQRVFASMMSFERRSPADDAVAGQYREFLVVMDDSYVFAATIEQFPLKTGYAVLIGRLYLSI